MPPNESSSVSVSRCGDRRVGSDPPHTVVWVRGEHDVATRVHLSVAIDQAASLDDGDIVVDLSGVTFMDASTIGALVAARNRHRTPSRSLTLRAPSPRAQRLLDLCGPSRLMERQLSPVRAAATALGSWVEVPASERGQEAAQPPAAQGGPSQEPPGVMARRCVQPEESIQQRRAPS